MSTLSMSEAVELVLKDNPRASNEDVARILNTEHGFDTTPASVGSTKSRMKSLAKMNGTTSVASVEALPVVELIDDRGDETDDERSARIRARYDTLQRMAQRVVDGQLPSLIVSGPPGLGKSFTIEETVRKQCHQDGYAFLSGTIAGPGLYMALYYQREGGIVILDDCDDVFRNEACMNILKAVLDSSNTRIVSYKKEANWLKEYDIPNQYEFKGTVVFCTNIDFHKAISKNTTMAPHFSALIDRSLYLSLDMRSMKDYLMRLYQVGIEDKLLEGLGLSQKEALEVFEFIKLNTEGFHNVSLRLLLHIAHCYQMEPDFWQHDVQATKMHAHYALKAPEKKSKKGSK